MKTRNIRNPLANTTLQNTAVLEPTLVIPEFKTPEQWVDGLFNDVVIKESDVVVGTLCPLQVGDTYEELGVTWRVTPWGAKALL